MRRTLKHFLPLLASDLSSYEYSSTRANISHHFDNYVCSQDPKLALSINFKVSPFSRYYPTQNSDLSNLRFISATLIFSLYNHYTSSSLHLILPFFPNHIISSHTLSSRLSSSPSNLLSNTATTLTISRDHSPKSHCRESAWRQAPRRQAAQRFLGISQSHSPCVMIPFKFEGSLISFATHFL